MTMISHLTTERLQVRPIADSGEELPEAMVIDIAVPKINGTYLINNGQVQLVHPTGHTLVLTTPIKAAGQVLMHLAFGTELRRIAHNMTLDDFDRLLASMQTAQALARLEQGEDGCSPPTK